MSANCRTAAPPAAGAFAHVHLQWFAASDDGRTEPPTALRMRAAREAGQVARSPELPAALMLLGGVATLALLGPSLLATTRGMLRHFLAGAATLEATALGSFAPAAFGYVARLALPVAAVALAAALCGHLIQGGMPFAARPVKPDATRIVPQWARFYRRAFSAEAAINLIKELLKLVAIGAIAVLNIGIALERLAVTPVAAGGAVLAGAALRIGSQTAFALLLLAILDYLLRRYRQHRGLRMSPQEVREERRRQEGDPVVRDRLRARMRELLTRTMGGQVAAADVVIAHGDLQAVALRWDSTTMPAPVVVAKGVAATAQRIGALAADHGVAVVQNRPLADALCHAVAIGDPIPGRFYPPAAAIFAKLRGPGSGGTAWRP